MPQRIVACQGPIQLVTAIAVLRQRDRESPDQFRDAGWDDNLAIMELAAPPKQEQAFVAALRRMAGVLRSWKSIVHVQQPEQLERLDEVGEVYVVREWQRSNQALFSAFPAATKICFGDSIGIYLAPTYMAPRQGLVRRFARRLMHSAPAAPLVSPDWYYLTLPGAFDPVPSCNVKVTDAALLRQALADLRPLLPRPLLTELRSRLGQRRLVAVVGSNFSEQGVMSPEAEVTAYIEYLKDQDFDRDPFVLLKPHPRDRMEKVLVLESALRRSFGNVFTLTDAIASYLPLETLLLEMRPPQEAHLGVDLCTFSSACLASKYVLGIQPRIGFGTHLVRRHFSRPFVEPRMRHERQLRAACNL